MPKIQEIETQVIEDFNNNIPIKNIAKKFNVNAGTIYYILKKNNIVITHKVHIDETFIEQIQYESQKGISLEKLSIKYNIDKTKLCKLINSYNISDTIKQAIINLRQANYSYTIIAQRLSITVDAVKEVLRSFNIQNTLKRVGLTKNEILEYRKNLNKED